MQRLLIAAFSVMIANVASAHPGHGTSGAHDGQSWSHFIAEPVHAIPLISLIVLAVIAVRFFGSANPVNQQTNR
jgi:hypothetical protein